MRLDEQGLDEYTDRFEHDAFRHECIDGVGEDSDAYTQWRAGELVDPAVGAPWRAWVAGQVARGAAVRRLRTLTAPPSEYVRFEAEVFYTANAAAGEDIRILDLAGADLSDLRVMPEFWMMDHSRVALMHYRRDGLFSHAETLDVGAARQLREDRDRDWSVAEPFGQWWARHPEHHRARV